MGIVLKQSLQNTLTLILGFGIGGVNALFLYTHFLQEEYYGLTIFILSAANILMPLMVFGMQHAVIKFFSSFNDKENKDRLLSWSLIFPLFVILPLAYIGGLAYETISLWISKKNGLIQNYTYLIFLVAVFMGYFEVFYAWTKVQMNSVFGSFVREVFARLCAAALLIAVHFEYLSVQGFIYGIVAVYFLRMLIMLIYALYIYKPSISLVFPQNFKAILRYAFYIILAGSVATLLLEIDKFMIPQMKEISMVAYYAVGVYIASVIAIPSRAMNQITYPITAKHLNEGDLVEVNKLYKQSSINLLVVGGFLFLLINLNIVDMYRIINKPAYSTGILIVFIISVSELIKLALGTNGAILTNSKYYKVFFYLSIAMALCVIVLNKFFIQSFGINGAALATLVTVALFSFFKVVYIRYKLDIQPFSKKSILLFLTILVVGGMFYYIQFSFHPIVNIILKSTLISIVYIPLVYVLNISSDLKLLFTSRSK